MTQHIIDTDELEKLKVMNRNGDLVIYYDDLIKALANSPQADAMVLTSEMISAGAVPINNWNNRNRKNKTPISPMERVIAHQVFDAMKAAYKPQADDVRKDAERYRWLRDKARYNSDIGTPRICDFNGAEWINGESLDNAIDKARE